MKTTKKITFFLLSCIAFSNLPTHCFYNDGNNIWRGAAIGGLAGGRRGAAIGLGVGAATDIIGNAAADADRRRYEDSYYYNKRRNYLGKHRQLAKENEDLQRKNEELQQRLDELKRRQSQN